MIAASVGGPHKRPGQVPFSATRVAPADSEEELEREKAEELAEQNKAAAKGIDDAPVGYCGPPGRYTVRQAIFETMEDPGFSNLAKWVSISMMIIILISTIAFVLESEVCEAEDCTKSPTGFLPFTPWAHVFYYVEWISVVIFTIEYNIRAATCPKLLPFVLNVTNLIDLVAWFPFWMMGAMQDPAFAEPVLDGGGDVGGMGFVRAVRLIRVFRVFKVGKYSMGIQMFAGALKHSLQPMSILVLVTTVAMIIFSSILWLIERPSSPMVTNLLLAGTGMGPCSENPHEDGFCMQAICFGTIPSAFWWALTTMTTVGYGDCYPITLMGKIVAVVAMVSGVIVLALPITVLGSNFAKMVEMYEEDEAAYTFIDLDGNGMVEDLELREFLQHKKKEGLLRRDVDTKVSSLMKKYDPSAKGYIEISAFRQLQTDVLMGKPTDPLHDISEIKQEIGEQREALQGINRKLDRMADLIERLTGGAAPAGRPLHSVEDM